MQHSRSTDSRAGVASIPTLLGACCFASMASLRACDTLLPALAAEFSVTLGQAARVILVFGVAYGIFQLVFGPLGDRFGKARVIALCALAGVIGNGMAFLSPDLDWLVAARIVSGAFAAGIFPLAMAWLGDNVPYESRQAALARLVSAGVMGMLGGQWLSGLIAQWVGWRPVFLVIAVLFLVVGALLWRAQRGEPPPAASGPTESGRFRTIAAAPASRRILAFVTLEGALALGALAFMPSLLQRQHGLSLATAGAIAACYGLGGILYTRTAVHLLRRFGETGLARLGGALLLVGLTSFAYVPLVQWAPVACLLAGFGFYGLHNTLQTRATQMAPAARGAAMSLFACCLFVGQSLGIMGVAWLADHEFGRLAYLCAGVGLALLGLMVAHRPSAAGSA
ncbi:MFS transporter [Yanghanlia caeni]|uniref:MFS transporter n=1 Tax=Yanghanlia caeni TaxID=3064283 RepID=A0ABU1D3W3_9BURK|nr:MFS transporter [Alcaligenaceae bacterium LG-2]HZH57086.1 MFS transporter [Burkholderiaceae bacterium]